MAVNRLRELIQGGEIKQARILARAIRKNDTIINIEQYDDYIHIETKNFNGIHDTKIVDNADIMINPRGEYELKSDVVDFKFKCHSTDDEILRNIYETINKSKESEKDDDEEISIDTNDKKPKLNILSRLINFILLPNRN